MSFVTRRTKICFFKTLTRTLLDITASEKILFHFGNNDLVIFSPKYN